MLSTIARIAMPIHPGAFRLVLALLVFVNHCSRFNLGKYAVYVFFVLSGFWVDRMWTSRYRRTRKPLLTYVVSRAWRLLPTFILVGVIVIALELAVGVPATTILGDRPHRLVFSSVAVFGYSQLDYLPMGPAWSLDIEMQFYALAPLLALIIRRMGVAMPLAVLAAISIASAIGTEGPWLTSYIVLFGVGMAVSAVDWRPSGRLAAASAGTLLITLVGVTLGPLRGVLLGGSSPSPLFVWNPWFNIAAAIVTIPFAIYTTRQTSDAQDRMMGDLSYIIYLAHWPVFIWLTKVGGSPLSRLPYFAIGWIAVIAGSWMLWRFYDRPINRRRAGWVSARVQPVLATA